MCPSWRLITLTPDGGECSVSRPITGLDVSEEEEIYCICRDSNPGLSTPWLVTPMTVLASQSVNTALSVEGSGRGLH
jgi:hypothetical protein